MRTTFNSMLYIVWLCMSLHMLSACSDNQNPMGNAGEESLKKDGAAVFGKSTEEKLDEFMIDYVNDLKAAMAEPDDNKTIEMLREMKEKYTPKATELKPEVEKWEQSMSEAEEAAFEKRAEQKPYFKDLFTVGFGSMNRINKNPKLEQAMEELNDSINLVDEEDISTQEKVNEQ